jgi:hypothetical protein
MNSDLRRICLFIICDSYNSTVSSSHFRALKGTLLMNNELEVIVFQHVPGEAKENY